MRARRIFQILTGIPNQILGAEGVLEFTVPAAEAKCIKSATLTVSVHNGSSRSGGRTYDIYPADITINADTTASEIKGDFT